MFVGERERKRKERDLIKHFIVLSPTESLSPFVRTTADQEGVPSNRDRKLQF